MHRSSRLALLLLLLPCVAAAVPDTSPFAALGYRFIGPPGNRVSAVAGVPGDPNTYYAGAASGGVWKSSDGGIHWKPVFDEQPAQSIGAIAIAPSDPNVVWVGTGEPFIRSNVSLGDGIYRSTDAGKTWVHLGLPKTGRIARVVVDPKNPDIALVAALGTCYGPQQERGVFRTADGGKTWQRVLFVDENTGASDLAMDPVNPRNVYAGTWPLEIKTWGRKSGGPGGGVFASRDGGLTWKKITAPGLPLAPIGKVAVAVGRSDPQRVYALLETGQRGSLWRSDNGGEKWHRVNASRLLNERPHYYTRMLVMPDDADEVYFPSNSMGMTRDGGETSEQIAWGGDNHDMWADPMNPSRLMIGSDGGVHISTTRGRQWSFVRLPIAQMYHVATDNRVPYDVYGQMQDHGPVRGPSNSRGGGGIRAAHWSSTAGCETGWSTPDPVDPDVVWGGCYAGVVERFDARTGMSRAVSPWPERTMGAPSGAIKLRMNWTHPLAISPHDHNRVYVGSQYVHVTTDGGQTWKTISPDLTLGDKSMMGDSGGLTVDNLSVEYAGVVFSLAESPLEKGVLWAGTNDGQVQVTRDAGKSWSNVTGNLRGLPARGTVSSVEPSRFRPGTAYVAIDLHQVDNRDPFLFRTTDYGASWTAIASDIPRSQLSYAHVVRESPHRQGLLFAGTENGLYVSFDDGGHWDPLQSKLPHAPVHWLTVQEQFHDLVVGTYGRGFFILDDLTPLEQLTREVRGTDAFLFAPRPAFRFRKTAQRTLAPAGTARGKDPAYGATLNYWLKEPVKTPGEAEEAESDRLAEDAAAAGGRKKIRQPPVAIAILDAKGRRLRLLTGSNHAGMNRVAWDLRTVKVEEVRLRATPSGNPRVWEEKRFRGKRDRAVFYYGIGDITQGALVGPGTYQVQLIVAGKALAPQPLLVKKDPNSEGSEADVAAATQLSMSIWEDSSRAARLINRIEWSRKQLEDLRRMLSAGPDDPAAAAAVEALDQKLAAEEAKLVHPTIAEEDQKSFRGPIGIYLKLLWLQAEVGSGGADVSGNADAKPTQAEVEVAQLLSGQLAEVQRAVESIEARSIPAFNEALRTKGAQIVPVVEAVDLSPEKPAHDDEGDDDW